MNDSFVQRLAAAVGAAWRTAIVWGCLLTLSWLLWLGIIHVRPHWVLDLWGGRPLTWATIQHVTIWFFGVFKIVWIVFVMAAVFLTFWLRGLRRAA